MAAISPEAWAEVVDAIASFSELLAGFRTQLITQGFSQEAAEAIVVEFFRKQFGTGQLPELPPELS